MLASSSTRRPLTPDELISARLASALDQVDLSTRRMFPGKMQGERRSKARGRSVEFEDFRPYVHGDDLRHVDWNVFARLDRFFIKIFQEEQDLALHIVLDASASMDAGTPNKLVYAQKVAMALGYLGLVNNNRVAMWIVGHGAVKRLPPLRGNTGVQRVAKFLIEETSGDSGGRMRGPATPLADERPVPPRGFGSFTEAMRTIATTRTGRGVMVVLSDLLIPEGYQAGLSLLSGGASGAGAPGWDITLIQVLSPGEVDPLQERSPSGERMVIGDLRLTDAETGRVAEVTVTTDLVHRYLDRLRAYQSGLHEFAAARGMQHLMVRSDADVTMLMLDELRRRGLVQ
ncbi:MAG TPA: DUF58 domain-containing protein [Phycisphaerales bacterium]|nr:DUF58 domain-containing protein [Phycisphaerales bacterium]